MPNEIRFIQTLSAIIVIASAFYGLVLLGKWLVHRPVFDVREIQVSTTPTGSVHMSAKNISNSLPTPIEGNFFTVNLNAVQKAFEQVPWVRKASVRRVWPNRLAIGIEEHQTFAIWNETRLMNTYAEVFTANIGEVSELTDLPALSGPDGTEVKVVQMYLHLKEWTNHANAELFPVALVLSSRFSWSVQLNSGLTIQLGREAEDMRDLQDEPLESTIQERYQEFLAVLPKLEQQLGKKIVAADLRYPLSRFAVEFESTVVANRSNGI